MEKNRGHHAALLLFPLALFLPLADLFLLLSAILLHEGGHLAALALLREPAPALRTVLCGLSLDMRRPLSYRREILVAAAGPLANLALAVPLLLFLGEDPFPAALGAVHALTALLNLLPIGRSDGARILFCSLALLLPLRFSEQFCRALGAAVFFLLLFLLLFLLMGPGGAGAILLILPLLLRASYFP